MQAILWDRRLCLMILDRIDIPTPNRLVVTRDSGPNLASPELARHVRSFCGLELPGAKDGTGGGVKNTVHVQLIGNGDTLLVDGVFIQKPFTEKPVNGKDNNMIIYHRSDKGGGGSRLRRQFGKRSSEYDPDLGTPRCFTAEDQSFIYEEYFAPDDVEDVKVHTVGPHYAYGNTRKWGPSATSTRSVSNRESTELSPLEKDMAARISQAFGQGLCTFDLIRAGAMRYVVGVTPFEVGISLEAISQEFSEALRSMFKAEVIRKESHDQVCDEEGSGPMTL